MSAAIEPNDSKSCRAALAWADAGVEVFSIHYGKKKPATTHGFLDATRGPDLIRAMFPPGRKRNLGIRTGERSGIVVIDEDGYKEGAKDTLKAIEAELGPLPETFTVQTRAGGRHLIFEYPEGRDLRCPSGEEYGLGFGIDVRGNGGYIVGPGSWVDQDNKGPPGDYKIIVNAPIAKLPAAWIDRIEALSRGQKPGKVNGAKLSSGLAAFGANVSAGFILPETIKEGGRNETLFRYLGHLLGKGVPKEIAEQAVRDANAARCQPSLDDAELEVILKPRNNATENEGQAEGEEWPLPDDVNFSLPAVPEFDPYKMLPPVLADYVADHAELLQVPPEVIASQLVVAMGAVIGNRVGVMPKRNDSTWVEVPNLWNFVVMPPGHKKTPAQQRALAPLRQCERLLEERHKKRLAEYEVESIQHKVRRAMWEKGVKEGTATAADKPPDPEEPREARLIVGDSTLAKLEEQLRDSLHGLMLERDEMAGLWSALNRPEAAGDREKYLTTWNGTSTLKTDRIGRGSTIIPMATLAMVGGTQPPKLAQAVRDAVKNGVGADGWIQRYSMAVFPDADKPYRHVDRLPDFDSQEKLFNRTRELFDLDPVAIGARKNLGSSLYCLKFTNEAQDGFDSWIVALENLLRSGNLHPAIESHFSKYRGLVPKLALIFHLVEDGAGPITLEALMRAIKWQVFLQAHARRIYAGVLKGADLATKNLADRIRAGRVPDGFKARDIRLKGWAGLTDKEDVDAALEGLTEAGWIRPERISGNGRPTSIFWINPKIIQPKP